GPLRPQPPGGLSRRGNDATALVVNPADDARPEAGPVGLGHDGGFGDQGLDAADLADLLLARRARRDMPLRPAGFARRQSAVEVGTQSSPHAIAGQHVRWTVHHPTVILMRT